MNLSGKLRHLLVPYEHDAFPDHAPDRSKSNSEKASGRLLHLHLPVSPGQHGIERTQCLRGKVTPFMREGYADGLLSVPLLESDLHAQPIQHKRSNVFTQEVPHVRDEANSALEQLTRFSKDAEVD